MWHNKYVGIPYKDNGRDTSGIDCWGLVRLIYKEQYNIDIPSFVEDYNGADDRAATSELAAIAKEEWRAKDTAEEGDVVLFRVLGVESHVGVCIGGDNFIHAKEGQASVVESLTSSRWKDRIVGYFKYTADPTITAIPHPFKTDRYTDTITPGTTIAELVESINKKYEVSDKLKFNLAIMLNGVPVVKDEWATTVIKENDKLEYRAIPRGDDPLRMVLMVAVMIAAPHIAGTLVGTTGAIYTATTIAIQMVGMALINAIAPVRMPEKNNPGSPDSINMLSGGSNSANMYGTIPVILGRIRVTPPLGAQTIIDSPEDSSFLRMITVWGFGPLFLDNETLQIGGTNIQEFKDRNGALPNFYHLDFNTTSNTSAEITQFNSIYGYDTAQVVPNIELTLENNTIGSNEAILYKNNRRATSGISYSGSAVDANLRLIVDENTGSFYLRDEGWLTAQATFGITAIQNSQTSATTVYTVRKNQAGGDNFSGTAPFAIVRSSTDVVSMDGDNRILLPTGNRVILYGYGKEMSAAINAGIYAVTFSLVTAESNGQGLVASINSATGEITLSGAENWTGTTAEFKFRANYNISPGQAGGQTDATYKVLKPTASELSGSTGVILLKYETDVFTASISGVVSDLTEVAGPWSTITLPSTNSYTSLEATLHFPEGLRKIQMGGTGAGTTTPASFIGEFQYRGRADSGQPWPDWIGNTFVTNGLTFSGGCFLPDAEYYAPVIGYKWIRVYFASGRGVEAIEGPISTIQSELLPDGNYASTVSDGAWGPIPTSVLKPDIPTNSILLYEICLRANQVGRTVTQVELISNLSNIGAYSGLGITAYVTTPNEMNNYGSGYTYTIAPGYLHPDNSVVNLNGTTVKGSNLIAITDNLKDAFNRTITLDKLSPGQYQIRFRRLNSSNPDVDPEYKQYYKAIFYSVTGRTSTDVIIPPMIGGSSVKLARTAFRFESSAKVNGQIDGINGVVQTIARIWDDTNFNWNTPAPTSNPASLFLHVLTHPANAYRITSSEENTRIKLTGTGGLSEWYTYCKNNGFEYNNVMDGSRSVLEVLRDIAAAGRASPIIIDGKWTVVVDQPRTTVVQHFSPHNSWGFESTKAIPKLPHAFRIVYRDEQNGYQETEQIVYNQGYNEANAELFEEMSLPGITNRDLVIKHARWNLAQIKLRPERYTLNTDLEYIVCNRGDLVKVVHDVPMWGLGSGRIKNYINSTTLELDEPIYMASGTSYIITIRTESGSSVVRTVVAPATSGYKTQVTLSTSVTATEGTAGNLFLFGTLSSQSHDLIVLNIEPLDNRNARLTLVDYSQEIYSIDQSADFPIPSFNPDITAFATIDIQPITAVPIIGTIRSDIGSMDIVSGIINIDINILNDTNLPELIDRVELYYYNSSATNRTPISVIKHISAGTGSFTVSNVTKGDNYIFKARYLDKQGRIGPWSTERIHTVAGKGIVLDVISELTITRVHKNLIITPVIVSRSNDFSNYEIRVIQDNSPSDFWNTNTNYVKVTSIDTAVIDLMQFPSPRISSNGITYSVACRAIDYQGNSSTASIMGQITLFDLEP